MTKLTIAIAVDDVAPTREEGILREHSNLQYLLKLNEEFGCKFTLFVIPLYLGQEFFSIEKNPRWVKWIKEQKWAEIAGHGLMHCHMQNPQDAREFADMDEREMVARLQMMKKMFDSCGINIYGFRGPGWTLPNLFYTKLKDYGIKYIADHTFGGEWYQLTNGMKIVPYTMSIDKLREPNKMLKCVFIHSHISKGQQGTNTNDWCEENYNKFRTWILDLKSKGYELEFKTMSEIISDNKFRMD